MTRDIKLLCIAMRIIVLRRWICALSISKYKGDSNAAAVVQEFRIHR